MAQFRLYFRLFFNRNRNFSREFFQNVLTLKRRVGHRPYIIDEWYPRAMHAF